MRIERKPPQNAPYEAHGPTPYLPRSVGESTSPTSTPEDTQPCVNVMFSRMRAGAISISAYLDDKIATATAHLRHLSPSKRNFIENSLRAQLHTDLGDLVRRATT